MHATDCVDFLQVLCCPSCYVHLSALRAYDSISAAFFAVAAYASERWSGYYGEWGGLGEKAGGLEGGGVGEVAGVGGGGYEGGEGVEGGGIRKAGFSTFHIRRGDFQYTKVRLVRVLVVGLEVSGLFAVFLQNVSQSAVCTSVQSSM